MIDYEYESGGDSDEMESEGTPSSASSEYEPGKRHNERVFIFYYIYL